MHKLLVKFLLFLSISTHVYALPNIEQEDSNAYLDEIQNNLNAYCKMNPTDNTILAIIKQFEPFNCSSIQDEIEFCKCINKIKADSDTEAELIKFESEFKKTTLENIEISENDRQLINFRAVSIIGQNNLFTTENSCLDLNKIKNLEYNEKESYKRTQRNYPTLKTGDAKRDSKDYKFLLDVSKQIYKDINDNKIKREDFEQSYFFEHYITKIAIKPENQLIAINRDYFDFEMREKAMEMYKDVIYELVDDEEVFNSFNGTDPKLEDFIFNELKDTYEQECKLIEDQNNLETFSFVPDYQGKDDAALQTETDNQLYEASLKASPNDMVEFLNTHLSRSMNNYTQEQSSENQYNFIKNLEEHFLADLYFCQARKQGQDIKQEAAQLIQEDDGTIKKISMDYISNQFNIDRLDEEINELKIEEESIRSDLLDRDITEERKQELIQQLFENQSNLAQVIADRDELKSNNEQITIQLTEYLEKKIENHKILGTNNDPSVLKDKAELMALAILTSIDPEIDDIFEEGMSFDDYSEEKINQYAQLSTDLSSNVIIQALGKDVQTQVQRGIENKSSKVNAELEATRGNYEPIKKRKKFIRERIQAKESSISTDIKRKVLSNIKGYYKEDPIVQREVERIESTNAELVAAKEEVRTLSSQIENLSSSNTPPSTKAVDEVESRINNLVNNQQDIFNRSTNQKIDQLSNNNSELARRINDLKRRQETNTKMSNSLLSNQAQRANKKIQAANEDFTQASSEIAKIRESLNSDIDDNQFNDDIYRQEQRVDSLLSTIERAEDRLAQAKATSSSNTNSSSPQIIPEENSETPVRDEQQSTTTNSTPRATNFGEQEIQTHRQALTNITGIQDAIVNGVPVLKDSSELLDFIQDDFTIKADKVQDAPEQLIVKTDKGVVLLQKKKVGEKYIYEKVYRSGKLDISSFVLSEQDLITDEQLIIQNRYSQLVEIMKDL